MMRYLAITVSCALIVVTEVLGAQRPSVILQAKSAELSGNMLAAIRIGHANRPNLVVIAESAITPEVVRATIDALNAAFVASKSTADRAVVHYINRNTLSPRLKVLAADSALVRALWGSDVRSIDGVGRGRTLRLSSTTKGWIPGPMRVSPP